MPIFAWAFGAAAKVRLECRLAITRPDQSASGGSVPGLAL
jgi:hypothetical protein